MKAVEPTSKVAVSLMPRSLRELQRSLAALPAGVGMAEVRLDSLDRLPDMAELVARAPVPLIATCRPAREGGRYEGPESCRIDALRAARDAGARWVDVEWDSVAGMEPGGVLVSRHWHSSTPADLVARHAALARNRDAVKVAAVARTPVDVALVLDVLGRAVVPTVAIAMGYMGAVTRVLAPCFASTLLTYASADTYSATASGQLPVRDLIEVFALDRAGPRTAVCLHTAWPSRATLAAANQREAGRVLRVPVSPALVDAIVPVLRRHLAAVEVVTDG